MAQSVIVDAIASLTRRPELLIDSPRIRAVEQYRIELMTVFSNVRLTPVVEQFSHSLLTALEGPLHINTKPETVPKIKERIWTEYAAIRARKLPRIWSEFLSKVNCEHIASEPLLMEIINESIFQDLVLKMFQRSEEPCVQECVVTLNEDEENIIRYVCGYIGMKLRSKYLKMQGDKAAEFVECLDKLQVGDHQMETASFLAYTTKWINLINRGRLFQVNDNAYLLFREIEITLQHQLSDHIKASTTMSSTEAVRKKEIMISSVCQNTRVQSAWDSISCIRNEDYSKELLTAIITYWLDIRGFSYAKKWIEDYKHILSIETKKRRSLRKELRKEKK